MRVDKIPDLVAGTANVSGKALFVAGRLLAKGRNAVFLSDDEEELADFQDAASAVSAMLSVSPAPEIISCGETGVTRSLALKQLLRPHSGPRLVVSSWNSFAAAAPDAGEYAGKTFGLKVKDKVARLQLRGQLEACGYERAEFVENPGEYALRGSVVDIFCLGADYPARLYFSGDFIESARFFDPETQNSVAPAEILEILPARLKDGGSSLKNWLSDGWICAVSEDGFAAPAPGAEYPAECVRFVSATNAGAENYQVGRHVPFSADIKLLGRETARFRKAGMRVVISVLNRGELERMEELLAENSVNAGCELLISPIKTGFWHKETGLAVITSGDIFARRYASARLTGRQPRGKGKFRFKEFSHGDYVVHQEHGIGRYQGLKTIGAGADDSEVECMAVEYRSGHKLFVPVYDFKKIQKYIGGKGRAPRLSSLNTGTWGRIKSKITKEAEQLAGELLKLEAQRRASRAAALDGEPHIEREFADSFPYDETPDQGKAISSVLEDMSGSGPMDRVVIGDVGFGKTEIAMRAALKCALSGRQTALFVPTTVLAAQHYRTFSSRFAGYPVRVEMLSRFQQPAEQKRILALVWSGACDIVIGTHRLFSKDVRFKALGLCVIDEEHRFGVKHKEKIRSFALGVHTLMLSATPIPRTLNQALSGLRDVSVLETPPPGRMPISTRVLAWDEAAAADAIRAELGRGGQVYYVYNRVRTLKSRLEFLRKLVPEARICAAHGQMPEAELDKAMWDFYNGSYDVLIASTIIESGLDIPSVNTLIVEDAHDLGLAQMYQLRGRIGRGDKKAHCWLFYPPGFAAGKDSADKDADAGEAVPSAAPLSGDARKRLESLIEFGDLGSGYRLALRDMEIRGAGELLGTKQHGFISQVGLSLYCELVAEASARMRGKQLLEAELAELDVNVPAFIPAGYMPEEAARLEWYKKLTAPRPDGAPDMLKSLEDICGPAPEPVKNIVRVINLRLSAAGAGIRKMLQKENSYEIYFKKEFAPSRRQVDKIFTLHREKINFLPSAGGDGVKIYAEGANPLAFFEAFTASLS